MSIKMLKISLLLTAFSSSNVLAENVCLEDLTDAAKSAKQCIVSSNDPTSCKSELKTLEIQELICERDGYPKDKIQLSMRIGNMMVDGDVEDSALGRLVAGLVFIEVDSQLKRITAEIDKFKAEQVSSWSDYSREVNDVLVEHVSEISQLKFASDSKALDARFQALENQPPTSLELERRLKTIEERLKAIDASRISLNAELLKVQGQVNGLMLDRTLR